MSTSGREAETASGRRVDILMTVLALRRSLYLPDLDYDGGRRRVYEYEQGPGMKGPSK